MNDKLAGIAETFIEEAADYIKIKGKYERCMERNKYEIEGYTTCESFYLELSARQEKLIALFEQAVGLVVDTRLAAIEFTVRRDP